MTLIQLEYIIAVDIWRHFSIAAENCYVTQPTLSMQIQKLEVELGVKIFDRSVQPVVPTDIGQEIIASAKKILAEHAALQELIRYKKKEVAGELRIGIIATIAPYLLPLFVSRFTRKYPNVKLIVQEMMTDTIVRRLREGKIDAGILATPLQEDGIKERVIFYEELMVYVSPKNAAYKKTYLLPQDIKPDKLWLLEEGHCFRSQIMNLCELKKISSETTHFDYQAGSIETLRKMVELGDGITIIPELATLDLPGRKAKLIRYFKSPSPMREVSVVVHRDFVKKRLIDALYAEIVSSLPEKIQKNRSKNIVPLEIGGRI